MVRHGRTVLRLLVCLILLNLPYWLIAEHVFLARAKFSLDAVLALLVFQVSPALGLMAVAASWLADLLVSLALTYHFASPLDFIASLRFSGHLDWSALVERYARSLVLTLPFLASAVALCLCKPGKLSKAQLLGMVLVLVLVDASNGSSALSSRAVRTWGTNLAGSSAYAVVKAAVDEASHADEPLALAPEGGMDEMNRLMPKVQNSHQSLVYVVVESFGVHQSPAVRSWLGNQLMDAVLHGGYKLEEHVLGAQGSTTSGELRRLCGLVGSYRRLDEQAGLRCIPSRLAAAGWQTRAWHGFSAGMFDRRHWWPLIGLSEVHFGEDLASRFPRRCGAAFSGICDLDLLREAVQASKSPKTLAYVLTLNTHLPVPPIAIPDELAALCRQERTGPDVCTLVAHLGELLHGLAGVLAQAPHRPSVLIVGDHPPPFSEPRARAQFLLKAVPAYALVPSSS